MKLDKGPLSWLKKQFSKEDDSNHKKGKYTYLVAVLIFGTMIMLISNLFINNESASNVLPTFNNSEDKQEKDVETFGQKNSSENSVIHEYEQSYEAQLKEALDTIVGVSDVTVVVNVDATEKQVLEKNIKSQSQVTDEIDREGGKRKVEDQSTDEQPVIIQNGEKEVPIVVETRADNIQVKKWILEAVTRALDVPSHRVSVLPKKTKGDS
jgi:stage III sporulation protein AG